MFVLNVLKKMGTLATSQIWTNHNDEVETKNIDLQEINYSMFNDGLEHIHVDKQEDEQLILDEVVKYEELKRQILYADRFVEDMMEDSKWLMYKFEEIYSKLCNKCLSLSKKSDMIDNYVECLNAETDDLNTNYKFSQGVLKKLEEENARFDENINKLEESLFAEYKNKTFLKYQNENQKMCLKDKCEQIAQEQNKLVKKTDELNREKEKTSGELKPKLEDCAREIKQLKIDKSLHIIMVNRLKKELEMEKHYGRKLQQTISCQKNKKQELSEKLEKCKEQFEILKKISESTKTDAIINTLRAEKTIVDLEKRKVETEFNENKHELKKLEYYTEQINTNINRFECKLDEVIKNGDENEKSSMEKVDEKQQDVDKLTTDLNAKRQCIAELRTTLSEMKELQRRESDEVRNLKTQLNDLRDKQINTVIKSGKYPDDGDHDNMINCNPQTICENIEELDNFPSAGGNIINSKPSVLKRTKSLEEFEEKNTNFENLIKKCNSLINNYY